MDMAAHLTHRQRAFIEHYLMCWSATEAARRAGYSPKTANQQGPRLLVNVGIQAAISARLGELQATADEVKLRLTRHARGTMEDFLSGPSNRIDLEQARERGQLDLVKKYRLTTITDRQGNELATVEVELYDAQSALMALGRAQGIFVDRHELTGAGGAPLTPISIIEVVEPESSPVPAPVGASPAEPGQAGGE